MCRLTPYPTEPKPEQKLADLMARELQVWPNAIALRLFIRCHWSKVSMLAHQIHDEGGSGSLAEAIERAIEGQKARDATMHAANSPEAKDYNARAAGDMT